MKKGRVYTCNGCLAFEPSVMICPPGSPAGLTPTKAYCGIGNDIEPIKADLSNGEAWNNRPESGTCEKPKTISAYVKAGYAFRERCMNNTDQKYEYESDSR